jgi:lauroyl/myristoyl acyltransferase
MELGGPFVPGGDRQADAEACNRELEQIIRRSPEEWTWFHDRYAPEP